MCARVCCNVLWCVAVRCSRKSGSARRYLSDTGTRMVQFVVVCCCVLQSKCVTVCCCVLQPHGCSLRCSSDIRAHILRCVAVCCNVLQPKQWIFAQVFVRYAHTYVAVCLSVLLCIAAASLLFSQVFIFRCDIYVYVSGCRQRVYL